MYHVQSCCNKYLLSKTLRGAIVTKLPQKVLLTNQAELRSANFHQAMAKEKPLDPERAARKAEKKANKKEAKRSETDGVHKPSQKEKKTKDKTSIDVDAGTMQATTELLSTLEAEKPGTVVVKEDDEKLDVKVKIQPLLGALVPFAHPLADEKVAKKVLRSVKKGMNHDDPKGFSLPPRLIRFSSGWKFIYKKRLT